MVQQPYPIDPAISIEKTKGSMKKNAQFSPVTTTKLKNSAHAIGLRVSLSEGLASASCHVRKAESVKRTVAKRPFPRKNLLKVQLVPRKSNLTVFIESRTTRACGG